eukprot:scaffold26664_cov25-Cyclotella_meneghiniana.AAC.1
MAMWCDAVSGRLMDGRLRNCWTVSGRLDSAATASDVNGIVTTNSSIQWTNHRLRVMTLFAMEDTRWNRRIMAE